MDYMATTPVDPRVIEKMLHYLGPDGDFGNPASSSHVYGQVAALAVDEARHKIAEAVGARAESIVFTSGATEADNLAILGAARFYQRQGKQVITMQTEHKAVLDSFQQLEKEGFTVSYLPPKPDGLLDLSLLEESLTNQTILVSIMQVNNETGVIQDIAAIGKILREKGIIFHVDAAQSAGKIPIDLRELPVDLMSFSAHKNYGPKGIGALYVRQAPRLRLQPLSFGGGHESGLRSGTLPTHQIVGMGEAFALSQRLMETEQKRLCDQRNRLWEGIQHLPGIQLNGHPKKRVAGNLNISFANIEGDALLLALHALAISAKSACLSASTQPSHVLRALGLSEAMAVSAVRLSLGRFTKDSDIEKAIEIFCKQIVRLHEISEI
jgi:cysteine desulfurase